MKTLIHIFVFILWPFLDTSSRRRLLSHSISCFFEFSGMERLQIVEVKFLGHISYYESLASMVDGDLQRKIKENLGAKEGSHVHIFPLKNLEVP